MFYFDITSTGIGKQSYYVSRLAAGEWQVTVNGQSIGTFTVTEAEHLLTFSAVSGNVTVRPLS